MSLWTTDQLRPWAYRSFTGIVPERVLVELDSPLTFTFRDNSGNLMLAHWSDEYDGRSRYIVAPTNDEGIERLERGTVSLTHALDQPIIWILDLIGFKTVNSWAAKFTDVPADARPAEEAMLHPRLNPLFKLKVPDTRYRHGAIGADAARSLFDGAQAAMAKLLEHTRLGASEDYDLEAQQLAFNSIEVAFQAVRRNPSKGRKDDSLQSVTKFLGEGFQWASGDDQYVLPGDDKRVILEALRELAPKESAPIMLIQVSGRAVPESLGRVELTSNLQARIARQIPAEHRPRTATKTGFIREYDKDNRSFHVRSRVQKFASQSADQQRFFFDPEKEDAVVRDEDVMEYMRRDTRVRVSGSSQSNRYYVTKIEKLTPG